MNTTSYLSSVAPRFTNTIPNHLGKIRRQDLLVLPLAPSTPTFVDDMKMEHGKRGNALDQWADKTELGGDT